MSLSPTDATNLVVDVAALGVASNLGQKFADGIDKRTRSKTRSRKKHKRSKPQLPKSYKRAKARHHGLVSDLL